MFQIAVGMQPVGEPMPFPLFSPARRLFIVGSAVGLRACVLCPNVCE